MELMTYGQAKSMVDAVSGKIKCVTCLDVVPRWNSTNGSFHNGTYTDRRDYFVFGAQDLQNGKYSGFVSYTNVVSMCKQQLHEYRHWQQKQFFRGLCFDPSDGTLPVMPFPDDACCRMMARQRLIAAEFSAYQLANQFELSYEFDAEEYALFAVPDVLRSVGFPEAFIEPCLVEEVNRRYDWYGDRPVVSIAAAISDLHDKKQGPCSAVLPTDYPKEKARIVANSFLDDETAQKAYALLDLERGDAFLIDYIGRRDPVAFSMYAIIQAEMPVLRPSEIMKRKMYRMRTGLPDINGHDGADGPNV